MAKTTKEKFKGILLPHIGIILKKHIKENRLYQSGWARKQGVLPITILGYFKKQTMQISTLFIICQVLDYNFFKIIADALPKDMPPESANPLQEENNALKKENEQLKMQIEIMERMMKK